MWREDGVRGDAIGAVAKRGDGVEGISIEDDAAQVWRYREAPPT